MISYKVHKIVYNLQDEWLIFENTQESIITQQRIEKLTPEIMHEMIDKIIVHEADKSSGKRYQQIEICYRSNMVATTIEVKTGHYGKKTA